jgi:phage terminase small subunit
LEVWIQRGRQGRPPYAEFVERVDRARAEAEVRQVSLIAGAAAEDWRAATYLLDRRIRTEDPVGPLDTRELANRAAEMARAEATSALEALGEPVEHSLGAIERYATAVAAWRSLEAHWEHLGRPGTAPGGATGTVPVAHPLLTQIAVARKEASQLGGLLGLDPLGRWKLARRISGQGRPAGAASAPDRVGVDPPRRRLRSVT